MIAEHARPARRASSDAARTLAGCERLIVTGSGVDEITARELALKIEEGVHVPVTPLGIEKVLHGHLPAADARTGIVVIRARPGAAAQRDARARDVAPPPPSSACRRSRSTSCPTGHAPLLAGAIALQLLTLELVHRRGHEPRPDPPRGAALPGGRRGGGGGVAADAGERQLRIEGSAERMRGARGRCGC